MAAAVRVRLSPPPLSHPSALETEHALPLSGGLEKEDSVLEAGEGGGEVEGMLSEMIAMGALVLEALPHSYSQVP
eukprot:1901874-Rhodomonas_salina.3